MSDKKKPLRMCLGCQQMKEKQELVRIVRDPEAGAAIDPTGKKNGRGAYVCKLPACMDAIRKNKRLNRAFGCKIEDEVYQKLIETLERKEY